MPYSVASIVKNHTDMNRIFPQKKSFFIFLSNKKIKKREQIVLA